MLLDHLQYASIMGNRYGCMERRSIRYWHKYTNHKIYVSIYWCTFHWLYRMGLPITYARPLRHRQRSNLCWQLRNFTVIGIHNQFPIQNIYLYRLRFMHLFYGHSTAWAVYLYTVHYGWHWTYIWKCIYNTSTFYTY